MLITRTNPFNGKVVTKEIDCTPEQFAAWHSGVLIQDAFPNLTAGEREFIKTGLTDEDWDELFSCLQ